MDKTKQEISNQAALILQAERSLQDNEKFKEFMFELKRIDQMKKDLKNYIKDHLDNLEGKEIVSPNGKQDYSFKLVERKTIKCTDINKVSEDLLDYEEATDVVEVDGKYYRLVPNTKAVKAQYVDLGKKVPKGFEVKTNKALYASINGERLGL